MRHQSEAGPTSAVKACKQQDIPGQENSYDAGPCSTLQGKVPAVKCIKKTDPVPCSTTLRPRRPLQQLSSNHQATVTRDPAKRPQCPPASCQQPEPVHLPAMGERQQSALPSDPSSTCEPPPNDTASLSNAPTAGGSCKRSEKQDSLTGTGDRIGPSTAAVPDGVSVLTVLQFSQGDEQLTGHPKQPILQTAQVSYGEQPGSSGIYCTSRGALATASLPGSPINSDSISTSAAAPARMVAGAEAALQNLHAQHPVTQIMQQAADGVAPLAAGGPALHVPTSSAVEGRSARLTYRSQEQPVMHHSVRPAASGGTTFSRHCSPNCQLAGPASSTAETAVDGSRRTKTSTAAAVAADGAVQFETLSKPRSTALEQVQQTLDAVNAKLHSFEAMRHAQSLAPSSVDVGRYTVFQPAPAANRQGYTLHTAAPYASRQHPNNRQRGQQQLHFPAVRSTPAFAPPTSQQHIRDRRSTTTSGSILGDVSQYPPVNQGSAVNSRAAMAAASALASGAIKPRPVSAECPVYDAARAGGNAKSASAYSSQEPGQDWKHWKLAADVMMAQQAPSAVHAAPAVCPAQLIAEAVPKLQAAAMPQFLQQHVAMAKRAAASLALQQDAALGGAASHTSQQQTGQVSAISSHGSCMSGMVPSMSAGEILQQSCPAALAAVNSNASQQSLMGQQLAASGYSRVGNMHMMAPLRSGMMHGAGTAAAAVAQQQTATAARVLQRLQAQYASHQQSLAAAARTVPSGPGLSEASSACAAAGARAIKQPAVAASQKLAKQQDDDSPPAADAASPADSDGSYHSCLEDTAASEVCYTFAPHMLRRTPYVGVGDRTYEAKDFDYIEYAKRRMHAEPHARDVFYVRDRRYESERLKQGARKRLVWTR